MEAQSVSLYCSLVRRLGEPICQVVRSGYLGGSDRAVFFLVSAIKVPQINMLRSLVVPVVLYPLSHDPLA